jgi:hypothetical protein
MRAIQHYLTGACLAALLAHGHSASGEQGPLPEFHFKGVALHPDNLSYAPTGDLIHPTIVKTEGRVANPLGRYYLYYAPHKHIATSMAYSNSLEGPWTEYEYNPVIKGPSAPDIRWIEEQGKFFMWGHRKNSQTELWTSEDGIHFEHRSVSITAKKIGTRNATYSRVYKYPLPRYGSKYIMLYSGFIEEKGIRCIWLAHSKDAENWTQLKSPLVEPVEGENNDVYGPALLQWNGRNFIAYQDHSAWRGGNIKYVEVDNEFRPVDRKAKRYVLLDPPSGPPLKDRYRGAAFYLEGDTLYMYSSGSAHPRVIVYATANAAPGNRGNSSGESIEQPDDPPPNR